MIDTPITTAAADSTSELIAATAAFFGEATPLSAAAELGGRTYELRPQQQQMAVQIAQALTSGDNLCIEAPTGVGKTFAYLVPLILHALAVKRPMVVATHTINLQEQIIDKDMPLLQKMFSEPIKVALAKGRNNYVCLRRLFLAGGAQELLPGLEKSNGLDAILSWAQHSHDGSRSDLPQRPDNRTWDTVCCEHGNCMNNRCKYYRNCFLMRARRRLLTANVIVANHALFFTDLAMKADAGRSDVGMLPAYAAVVLDEGHAVEEVASMHLGLRLSSYSLQHHLRRLWDSRESRGLLAIGDWPEARTSVDEARRVTENFFDRIRSWLRQEKSNPYRYRESDLITDLLSAPLERVEKQLGQLLQHEQQSGNSDEEWSQEVRALVEQVHKFRVGMQAFMQMQWPNYVYWLERQGPGMQVVVANAVPIQVAPVLREALFAQDAPVIVTSATLAVRGKMDYFQCRIGAEDAKHLVLDSPFNYSEQVSLYLCRNLPSPKNEALFAPAAVARIRHYLQLSQGRAFVLFTSYKLMREAAGALADFFATTGYRLMIQGEGLSRTQMVDSFRADIHSVIFGTDSFWTGVDVPGEALSNVIIVKLPFAVPDHPVMAARQEKIVADGGSAFTDYSLPEAILKFRQGFGRLIRSRSDRGMVVILDNRVCTTGYGKAFLRSLPACKQIIDETGWQP